MVLIMLDYNNLDNKKTNKNTMQTMTICQTPSLESFMTLLVVTVPECEGQCPNLTVWVFKIHVDVRTSTVHSRSLLQEQKKRNFVTSQLRVPDIHIRSRKYDKIASRTLDFEAEFRDKTIVYHDKNVSVIRITARNIELLGMTSGTHYLTCEFQDVQKSEIESA